MLIHEPLGLGHPYRVEPFERTPHYPIALEKSSFRVCCEPEISWVNLVLEHSGHRTELALINIGPAHATETTQYGQTAKEFVSNSHLADAAARSGEYSHLQEWKVDFETPDSPELIHYWFESSLGKSEVYSFRAHSWISPREAHVKFRGEPPVGLIPQGEEWLVDSAGESRRVRFVIPINEGERLIGFGERFHSVVQNGELVDAIVYEEYKGQGHRTYLPTPFAHVISGDYGFHVNISTPTYFDVGHSDVGLLKIEVEVTPGTDNLEVDFYSGNPSEVLKKHLDQVGKPESPPEWIYDLWISSNEWNTQGRVEREVLECLQAGIQPGVVVLEAWSDESTFTVFRDAIYNPTDGLVGLNASDITYPEDGAWPDPKQMIDRLHDEDIKLVLWQIPVLRDQGTPGSQAEVNWNYAINNKKVVLDRDGSPYRVRGFWFQNGLLPDLTDQEVRSWWSEQRRYLVEQLGVDGFKTDGGEHAWGDDLHYLDGKSGLEKNNLFPVHYTQTFHELLARHGKQPVTFSRAGFSGSQKYSTFWAGDENSTWQALRSSIRAGITASASGFYFWGWDIGGFSGEIPSPELFLRGAAMAAFCPIMQVHSEFNHHQIPSNDRTPWNLARRHNDPNIVTIFRRFVEIRKALIPYLAGEGLHAIKSGRPLMAGLFFDYFTEEEIWQFPYQYLLGRDLLVAPVVEEGQDRLKVYLPEGEWVDLFTKERFAGAQIIEKEVPLDEIAVFVKLSAWPDIGGRLPI